MRDYYCNIQINKGPWRLVQQSHGAEFLSKVSAEIVLGWGESCWAWEHQQGPDSHSEIGVVCGSLKNGANFWSRSCLEPLQLESMEMLLPGYFHPNKCQLVFCGELISFWCLHRVFFNTVKRNTPKIFEDAAIQKCLPFTEHAHMIFVHRAAESNHVTIHEQKHVFESYV